MEKKKTDNQQEIKQLIQFNPRKHLQREISLDKFSFVFFLFFLSKLKQDSPSQMNLASTNAIKLFKIIIWHIGLLAFREYF